MNYSHIGSIIRLLSSSIGHQQCLPSWISQGRCIYGSTSGLYWSLQIKLCMQTPQIVVWYETGILSLVWKIYFSTWESWLYCIHCKSVFVHLQITSWHSLSPSLCRWYYPYKHLTFTHHQTYHQIVEHLWIERSWSSTLLPWSPITVSWHWLLYALD